MTVTFAMHHIRARNVMLGLMGVRQDLHLEEDKSWQA